MTKRTDATLKKLQFAFDYYKNNPDKKAPKKLLKKLDVLKKKQSGEMTTTELIDVLNEITLLVRKGKKKQSIKQAQIQNRFNQRLNELKENVKPIESFATKPRNIGERLSMFDSFKNSFTTFANKAREKNLALTPMDVVFDMFDGGKEYMGAAHKIFKKTIDVSF